MRFTHFVPALAVLAAPTMALGQSAASLADVTFGEDISASLTVDDGVSSRGGYADRYTFNGAAGASVRISMTSFEIDCYLQVEGPSGVVIAEDDDGGTGTDSMLMLTLPSDGSYTVVATSYSAGAEGAYTLRVAEFVQVPLSPQTLTRDVSVSGRLDEGDATMGSHGYVDAYDIELEHGDRVDFVAESYDFDTYIYLIGPTGERVAEDDDSGATGTNSRITYAAQAAGSHRLLVTSFGGFSTGAYTVLAGEVGTSTTTAEPLAFGEVVSGELSVTDAVSDGGGHEDRYTVEVETGRQLVVSLSSDAFDTYLTLISPDGYAVAFDDDSGGNLNSRLSYVVLQEGTYTIVASSYGGSDGAYTISASLEEPSEVQPVAIEIGESYTGTLGPGDARPLSGGGFIDVFTLQADGGTAIDFDLGQNYDVNVLAYAPTGEAFGYDATNTFGAGFVGLGLPYTGEYTFTIASYGTEPVSYAFDVREAGARASSPAAPVAAGEAVQGTLAEGDDRSMRGGLQDAYLLTVDEPATYRITMTSDVVDGYLELYDADGTFLIENDDADGLNPAIRYFLAPGEYRIVATEYGAGGGPYVLRVDEVPSVPVTVESIAVGDHVVGMLSDTDAYSANQGNPADFFRIEVGAGQQVTVTLNSSAIDPYLLVVDPTGEVVVYDDDSGGGFNAQASFTAAASGVYTIVATGYDQRLGEYEMHVYEGLLTTPVGPEL